MILRLLLRKLRLKVSTFRHRRRLWRQISRCDAEKRAYFNIQLNRTLLKRNNKPELRAKLLIDKVIEMGSPPKHSVVLCVGPRNNFELEIFRKKGFFNVVGIDLFSESPDILVMDMHRMTFPDNRFDIIYCCHILEHAYDVHKAVSEIIRVARDGALIAIEVPVRFETAGADLIHFQDLDNLCVVFQPYIEQMLWSEEQPPHSPRNDSGTSIIRTVFLIRKQT